MGGKICCTCHELSFEAFERARAAGAHNVKTSFQLLGCIPKCAECMPRVRKVLSGEAAQHSNEPQAGASFK